ncbi:MAG: hypothetical protein ACK5MP_04080 [Nostocoides sp.]
MSAPATSRSLRPQVLITSIAAVVLALLGSCTVYNVAQPAGNASSTTPMYSYGSTGG